MSKFLGIDSSTQSMTGLVIDFSTEAIVAEESILFDDHFGDRYGVGNGVLELGPGEVHAPPLMWVEALDLLLERLRERCDLASIAAVSGCGQQHGTVYLNASAAAALARLGPGETPAEALSGVFSRPTAPVWMDSSTASQCREIEAGTGGRSKLLELTGNAAFERFSGPQIRKFFQTDPEGYEATATVCLVSSFIASLLAGRLVGVDAGDGSGTNLMDIRTRTWSPEAMAATAPGLSAKLLPVAASDSPAGTISPRFAGRYGFAPGCLVLPFSGDNPSSLIGLGLVEPGQVALSLGTSDTLFACMGEPRVSASGEGAVFASPDGNNYMALVCFMNGSLAREAVRDGHGLDWEMFTAALQRTEAGNRGALMLPYFDAEIVPRVTVPGVVREGLDQDDTDANVRAVIEAQALSSRIHCEWMQVPVSSLSVTGGASANTEILRVFANVHGAPVHRFRTTNSAALGAALRAAHGHFKQVGPERSWSETVAPFTKPVPGSTLQPDASARGVYDDLVEDYRRLESLHAG